MFNQRFLEIEDSFRHKLNHGIPEYGRAGELRPARLLPDGHRDLCGSAGKRAGAGQRGIPGRYGPDDLAGVLAYANI